MTPSSLNDDTEVSGGIELRKQSEDLRKQIGIIMDLEGFTVISRSKASLPISLRILIGSLIKFLKQLSTIVRSSTNFQRSGTSFARLLTMTEKRRGPRRVPWGMPL